MPDRTQKPETPPRMDPSSSAHNGLIRSTHRRSLRTIFSKYVRRHLPERVKEKVRREEPPRAVGTHAELLPILRMIPAVLAVGFAVSFAWDFDGLAFTVWGRLVNFEGLLRIASVSGLIGFLTNWLAITMLFQPRRPRPLVGQGLVPAQRERIAFRLAQAVSDELISEEIIKQKIHESGLIAEYRGLAVSVTRGVLNDPGFRRELKTFTADYVDELMSSEVVRQRLVNFTEEQIEVYAGKGVAGWALRAYRFVNESAFQERLQRAVRELPHSLDPALDEVDALLDQLPEKLEARADDIENLVAQLVLSFVENLDVERIVVENVRGYDEQQLEELLKRTTNEQLNYIKYLGGVLGLVGGLVIWEPIFALSLFAIVGGSIWVLDEALMRIRTRSA